MKIHEITALVVVLAWPCGNHGIGYILAFEWLLHVYTDKYRLEIFRG